MHRQALVVSLTMLAGSLLTACQQPLTAVTSPVPATATAMPAAAAADATAPTLTAEPTTIPEPTVTPLTATSAGPTADTGPQDGLTGANADVEYVSASQRADGTWTFQVTVRHSDTGWEDYADGWDVVLPDGTVVKPDPDSPFTRLLLHPHENEQPFTRSQSGIVIPDDAGEVVVRAHDLLDGWGGRVIVVNLAIDSGSDFEVKRRE